MNLALEKPLMKFLKYKKEETIHKICSKNFYNALRPIWNYSLL